MTSSAEALLQNMTKKFGEETMSEKELELQTLVKANAILQRENQLFEAYLARVPSSITQALEEEEAKKAAAKKRKVKEGAGKKEEVKKLSVEEKNDIASTELELVQAQTEKIKADGDKELSDISVNLEEIDMRIAETKKDMYEFKRDIIIGAENPRTGKTSAERMLKFLEDRLKAKDAAVEKIRLKNVTIKIQTQKMELQLHQKEDMGEVLHVVDFDQLKIENKQYLEKIEEKNNELLKLKMTTGKAVQVLGEYKSTLNALIQQGESLQKAISDRRGQLARFEDEWAKVTEEKEVVDKRLRRLKLAQSDTTRPQIIDYIRLTAEVHELEKKVTDWERKNEIADMDHARTKKLLSSVAINLGLPPQQPLSSPLVTF